ncbi:hypothetical protein PIB30_046159 [Stylosanthes scabra]|uniref:Non-structural maintenance of chromosomes element 1 homolog n=1 Tax=Stylosanthes scabra TaxID=79078 RepID=A0ABU6UJ43_9FABA|nr:hypothetical protein [Stylosanthes scabra]
MSDVLSWRHHAVIQALLSRGPLKENDLHSMFKELTKKSAGADRKLFDGFILKINRELNFVNFELRACIDQYDGQIYYGVVNTVSDEQSKLGTKYTIPQIAFYKALIEVMAQDAMASGIVSSIAALNLQLESQVPIVIDPQSQGTQSSIPPALRNFTKVDKEKALDDLVRDQWLRVTEDGHIKLGVKSFLDLRSWFRNNEIPSCQVCNEAGVKAELCQNENCTVRIHHYCLKQLFSRRTVEKVCPSCGTSWPYTIPKTEAAVTENENELPGSQKATGSRRNRRVVEAEDENEPRESQLPTGSRRTRQRTNSNAADELVESCDEGVPSQRGNEVSRKRGRTRRGAESQSESVSAVSGSTRRVTRSSSQRC